MAAMNIRPLHDRVIIRRLEEKTTKSGIIIPDNAYDKPMTGEVLAVGPGRREKDNLVPMGVAVGDRVIFGKYSGTEVKVSGEDVLIMREEDIMGILGS